MTVPSSASSTRRIPPPKLPKPTPYSKRSPKALGGPPQFTFEQRQVAAWLGEEDVSKLIGQRNLRVAPDSVSNVCQYINCLTKLVVLSISHQPNLKGVTSTVGALKNLQILTLVHNALSTLPDAVVQIEGLVKLHLHNNRFVKLPPMGRLVNLQELSLSENPLEELHPSICELSHLTTLTLRQTQLIQLPADFGRLTRLTTLNLSESRLEALPPSIGELKSLTYLRMDHCKLTELPDTFGQLSALVEVNLSFNKLPSLPGLEGLSSLTIFDLRGNQLTRIPRSISSVTALQHLLLNGNRLTRLPASIRELTQIKLIALRDNPLTPSSLGVLQDAFSGREVTLNHNVESTS